MAANEKIALLCAMGTIFCLLILPMHAVAALDTSGPIVCAFNNGYDCDGLEGCQMTTPESSGLPPFIRIDLPNKKVTTMGSRQTGDTRETTIRGMQEADGKLFLQGIERRGWSAVVDKETGQMTLSASGKDEAIVFFGRCTNP